ncbi:MAG: SagB/ThcOx family dehydrogenase [Candidatus Lokiarchaeota archaeon]|nr:SagB/ThcOx family dehydrogenase [Candidatus Lokiarchaeota archaeon]MBD3339102.1 SagB/ThcOx family dehydrogenase [Candidatus Lokiarchaeota archaeon]
MSKKLSKPDFTSKGYLEDCILQRESVRSFKSKKIEEEKLSRILWSAQGKKGKKRTVPSAGAKYPLELYIVIKDEGLFQYQIKDHSLKLLNKEELCDKIAKASWNQIFICEAPLILIICANFSRTTNRYGQRGVRYVHMEVGHCAQNVWLEVISLGLSSVPIGAFKDEQMKLLLELSEDIDPLYVLPIGYAR